MNIDHSGAIASKRHLLDVVGILHVDMPKIASKEGCENVREDGKKDIEQIMSAASGDTEVQVETAAVPRLAPPRHALWS